MKFEIRLSENDEFLSMDFYSNPEDASLFIYAIISHFANLIDKKKEKNKNAKS